MKIKKIIFVKIKSRFPNTEMDCDIKDMLRYDHAFRSTVDPSIVAFPTFKTQDGDLGDRITADRWRTFCVVMTPIEDAQQVADLKFGMNPDNFVTYRHVTPDYKTLVPFTLGQYQTAKDLKALDAAKLPGVMSYTLAERNFLI